MIERYRIVIERTGETIANSLNSTEEAHELLYFLQLEHPQEDLVIESYRVSTVKPGFGRDPDLH